MTGKKIVQPTVNSSLPPRPPIIWLFGLPSSGKTTLGKALCAHYTDSGQRAILLDGDLMRNGLCADLGFSNEDRMENLRRAAEIAKVLVNQDFVVVCAFITPKEAHRALVRRILNDDLKWVYVNCPLEVCVERDVKGLYHKAKTQAMTGMTGIQDSFEEPVECGLIIDSHRKTIADAVMIILEHIKSQL